MVDVYEAMDLLLLVFALQALEVEIEQLLESLESVLSAHIREQRRLNRSIPIEKKRDCRKPPGWDQCCSSTITTK